MQSVSVSGASGVMPRRSIRTYSYHRCWAASTSLLILVEGLRKFLLSGPQCLEKAPESNPKRGLSYRSELPKSNPLRTIR